MVKINTMLQSRLASILQRELQHQKLQLSTYCTQQIEQLLGQGIQRMSLQKSADNPAHVMRAERNLKHFIKYLSDYSRELGSYPTLSNSDFDTALNSSPTFWPYRAGG